jgi:hypothetical protein
MEKYETPVIIQTTIQSFDFGNARESDVPGMRHAMGSGYPMELEKPDTDVGKQPGQTAIHPEPGVRYHGSS